jgi:hypothetical protein
MQKYAKYALIYAFNIFSISVKIKIMISEYIFFIIMMTLNNLIFFAFAKEIKIILTFFVIK